MLQRGLTTALGAGLAWTGARFTGTQRRAATVALAAVVGTQLAQTLISGGTDRQVLAATIGSRAVLVGIIQTRASASSSGPPRSGRWAGASP